MFVPSRRVAPPLFPSGLLGETPNSNRGIVAPRQAGLAIGGKSESMNDSGVSLEAPYFRARLDVQRPQRLVKERAEQHLLAVGREGCPVGRGLVSREALQLFARFEIP